MTTPAARRPAHRRGPAVAVAVALVSLLLIGVATWFIARAVVASDPPAAPTPQIDAAGARTEVEQIIPTIFTIPVAETDRVLPNFNRQACGEFRRTYTPILTKAVDDVRSSKAPTNGRADWIGLVPHAVSAPSLQYIAAISWQRGNDPRQVYRVTFTVSKAGDHAASTTSGLCISKIEFSQTN